MPLHVHLRLIQLLLTFSCKYGFGLQPTHYTFKGCLTDKSLQINRKISCTLLYFLQRSAWTPSCAVPMLRPACIPRTFREALRLPCIDFYVPEAAWSRGLSKSFAPYSEDAQGCPGTLLWDPWRSWLCQGLCSPAVGMHAATPKKTLQPALSPEQGSIPWASSSHLFRRPHELHSLDTAASHLFTCLFFFLSPLHPLADGFPSDRTSPWPSLCMLFPLLSSRHCVGVGWGPSLPEGHCFVPTRCAEFLTLAPSEQPPASYWPCCNLDSQPFASPCSWFILLVFNVGFASLEKGYNHLGNTWRADLLSLLLFFFFSLLESKLLLQYVVACSSPASKFSAAQVSMWAFAFCH